MIRQAAGDPAGALEAITEAEQASPGPAGLLNPVPAQRARLLLAQGDLAGAARWTTERGLGADGREQPQPGDQYPAAAQQVPGPAAEQQQPAEAERIGVDHPLQAARGEPQRPLDVRQRHVHDRDIQHHHQLRGGDDDQRQDKPTVSGAGRSGYRHCIPPSCSGHGPRRAARRVHG